MKMDAPQRIGDFEQTDGHPPRFMHHDGRRLAIVERIGDSSWAAWGFVVWEEGFAVKGQCSGSWALDEACRRAKEWMARNPEDPR